jgi:hypothetical protein
MAIMVQTLVQDASEADADRLDQSIEAAMMQQGSGGRAHGSHRAPIGGRLRTL